MKRISALVLSLLLLLTLLAGCGGKAVSRDAASAATNESYAAGMDYGFTYDAPTEDVYYEVDTVYTESSGSTRLTSTVDALHDAKMIYRASIELQTTDYETSETAITELVKSCGGYFETKSLRNRSSGYRYADFTVRVPAAEFEHFCEQVGTMLHVTYMSSSAENITEAYYDTDARLKTAQIKLERLQTLLAKAETMADIITIESAISETEYEIESLSGTLRHYDALVDYATIDLSLSETYKLDANSGAPLTFGERLARAFSNGLASAGEFAEELLLSLASAWVALLVLAVLLLLAVRVLKKHPLRLRRKKQAGEDKAD